MDFGFSEEEERFRARVREFLQSNLPTGWGQPGFKLPEGTSNLELHRDWQRRLHRAGYAGMAWPKEYGGQGASQIEQAILNEEMARVRAPAMLNLTGVTLVGPTLIAHGTEEQKQRYLRENPVLRGNLVPALLRAQRRVRPRLAAKRARNWTATSSSSMARRSGAPAPSIRIGASCWPAPIPPPPNIAASATCCWT